MLDNRAKRIMDMGNPQMGGIADMAPPAGPPPQIGTGLTPKWGDPKAIESVKDKFGADPNFIKRLIEWLKGLAGDDGGVSKDMHEGEPITYKNGKYFVDGKKFNSDGEARAYIDQKYGQRSFPEQRPSRRSGGDVQAGYDDLAKRYTEGGLE